MTRIALLSDTHNYLDPAVFKHLEGCAEIWHAGDFGTIQISDRLKQIAPVRGVYGNIDGPDVRSVYPEMLHFKCEAVSVLMLHIGGYPGKYRPKAKSEIKLLKPHLFISGHSHILKIMFDPVYNCLHMNPGAAGRHGWHAVSTLIKFEIEGSDIRNCQVVELAKK